MSDTIVEDVVAASQAFVAGHMKPRDEQAQEPMLVYRTFNAEISADGDGRTIEGLVVPFNVETRVSDPPGSNNIYQESIAPGAFRSIVNAPNRVLLDFEHYGAMEDAVGSMGSIAGTLGHAVSLQENAAGLYGRFRVLNGSDGDKALELARAGVLGGFSVAMRPLRSLRSATGALQRVKVHLDRVSLCREGMYPQARVMAIRSQVIDAEDYEQPLDPDLVLRMQKLGITLPDRYKPLADEGTSEPEA